MKIYQQPESSTKIKFLSNKKFSAFFFSYSVFNPPLADFRFIENSVGETMMLKASHCIINPIEWEFIFKFFPESIVKLNL